jgi:YesN/AraC family two-component response regulator
LLPEETAHSHNGSPEEDASGLPVLLVVEDHAEVRSFIKTILQGEYQIIEASNGKAGIALALEHIPDLIISDVMMPDTDGLALCAKLKTHEFTSHIPIILLTAKAGDENALTGFEAGADDYITKPFSSALLKVRIQKLIELRRTLHERYSNELILKPKQIAISSTDEQFLRKIQHILDSHLTNSDFTVEMFASEIGMSRMQLHRKLKGLTGLSATNFIRSQRLTMAAELLGKSGANISEIGYQVGFNDPSYFSKCFKETYHCTPTEFAARN